MFKIRIFGKDIINDNSAYGNIIIRKVEKEETAKEIINNNLNKSRKIIVEMI